MSTRSRSRRGARRRGVDDRERRCLRRGDERPRVRPPCSPRERRCSPAIEVGSSRSPRPAPARRLPPAAGGRSSPSSSLTAPDARRTCPTPRAARRRSRRPCTCAASASRIGHEQVRVAAARPPAPAERGSPRPRRRAPRGRARVRSTWRRSASGSSRWSSISSASSSTKRLTPTTTRSPASTSRARRRNAASSISLLQRSPARPPRRRRRARRSARSAPAPAPRARPSATRRSRSRRAGRPCRSRRPRAGRICCVRSAIRAARSVGSASASSKRVRVDATARRRRPPRAPARSTRTTLFSGCCAVSVEPPVCAWKRSACAFGFVAPKRSRMIRAQSRARRAELRHLLEEVVVRVEEEREPLAELVGREPGRHRRLAVGDPVGERERELLHGRRARLADVVARRSRSCSSAAAARAQYANRSVVSRIDGPRREDVVPARDVLLEDVVLDGAAEPRRPATPCSSATSS